MLVHSERRLFFTLAPAQRHMNRPFELCGRPVNRFGERNRLVTDFDRLERAPVGFHATAHVALPGTVRNVAAEMDFDETDPVLVAIQRPLYHSLDPKGQLVAAIDVLVGLDPNLHLVLLEFATSKVNVAKNMPRGYPPFRLIKVPT
jgi:hypothetical protein